MKYLARWSGALAALCLAALAFVHNPALAQSNDAAKVFDHATTGFDLFGAHSFVPCESCHIDGVFDGTPTQCVGCHQLNGRFNAHPKPVDHILSSDQCQHCHNPTLFQDVPWVDHTQVFGECAACHNNVLAPGRPPNHIPVTGSCQNCHSTVAFTPVFFSHDWVEGQPCASCHNNWQASGRPQNHIPISALECDACHRGAQNTLSWTPVETVDHAFVVGACVSCHNNVTAQGQPPCHPNVMSFECATCHQPNAGGWQGNNPETGCAIPLNGLQVPGRSLMESF